MYHLAQVNIARMQAPLDDPLMSGFVEQLDTINALADGSPGFVWRLQTAEGNATALRPYDDDFIIVNLSLWASLAVVPAVRWSIYGPLVGSLWPHPQCRRGKAAPGPPACSW